MKAEDYVVVLDFLPRGKGSSFRAEPIAQVLGTEYFTLLEIVPKEGISLKAGDSLYVGKEERDKVSYIKKRISYQELTNNSIAEIDKAIEKIIKDNAQKFVDFFNLSRPITIKRHQLELLPGLGKKHMLEIVKQRELNKFESFEDLEKRIHLMPNPIHILTKRIIEELEGKEDKHFLFVRPPSKKPFDFE
jgi:putative nucleotide binding protein